MGKKSLNSIKNGIWFSTFLLALILFLIGCSENTDKNNIDEKPEITGSAIEDPSENCRFSDTSDCSPIEIRRGEPENEEHADNFTEDISITNKSEKNITIQNLLNLTLVCEAGWKCIEGRYTAYQEANCSWHSLERCIYGCDENESVCRTAPICKVNSLRCENDNLMICSEEGYKWMINKSCDKDCENDICTEDLAINATLNITTNDYIKDGCMKVINFNSDANGTDSSSNLNDEYFTLRNKCSYSVVLTNWTAKDATVHDFTFPSFSLGTNVEVTIYTGSGTDTSTDIYWRSGSHIWNNVGGDTLYLNASNGTLILSCSYIIPNNLTNLTCIYS